jgi:uncharacterized protein (TIGR02246 family)
MSDNNKTILEKANAAITQGDYEGFLSFCADDTEWTFVGDKTLRGKEAVRQWMATNYENGTEAHYSYCDVWRFRDGKMVELMAFVINS